MVSNRSDAPSSEPVITYRMQALARVASIVGIAAFALFCWILWRAFDHAMFGLLALGLGICAVNELHGLIAKATTVELSKEGLVIKRRFFFLRDRTIPWTKVDSAPQLRRFDKVGFPSRALLVIHLSDGSWKSINEDLVDEALDRVQEDMLACIARYGEFDPARAIPISVKPESSAVDALSPTLHDYAVRFALRPGPLATARALAMCFPKASATQIEAAMDAARSLVTGGGEIYRQFGRSAIGGEAMSALRRQFPGFSDEAYSSVLGREMFNDR